jgi:ribosome biogenesis GTPase
MGYRVLLTSAKTGLGILALRRVLSPKSPVPSHQSSAPIPQLASVVVGQSGVGKSSLLNMIEPSLNLRVATVSAESQKGRHTTTTAQLIPLAAGGYVIDTPGIRQFQLWDVIAEEVAGFYRDLRPYVSLCKFPNCTHTHESDCAIKDAVADGRLDARRYESYCQLRAGDLE